MIQTSLLARNSSPSKTAQVRQKSPCKPNDLRICTVRCSKELKPEHRALGEWCPNSVLWRDKEQHACCRGCLLSAVSLLAGSWPCSPAALPHAPHQLPKPTPTGAKHCAGPLQYWGREWEISCWLSTSSSFIQFHPLFLPPNLPQKSHC